VGENSLSLDLYGDGTQIVELRDRDVGPDPRDKNKTQHGFTLYKGGRFAVSSFLWVIKEVAPASDAPSQPEGAGPTPTDEPKVVASPRAKLTVGTTSFEVWWEPFRAVGTTIHVKYVGPNWCPVREQKLVVLQAPPQGDPKMAVLSNTDGSAALDLDGDGKADYNLAYKMKDEGLSRSTKLPERSFRFDLRDTKGEMRNWTAHLVRGPIEAETGKVPGVILPEPTPLEVTLAGDRFKLRARRVGDTNNVDVTFEYTGKEQVNRKTSWMRVLREDKLERLSLRALVNDGRNLHLDLSGDGKADLLLVHTVDAQTSGDERHQIRRHHIRQFDEDQQFKGELNFWVTGKAVPIPDAQDEKKNAPDLNAEFPTTRPPTQGNVAGERPKNYLKSGGITEIRMDGDGDQSKDLVVRVKQLEQHTSGAASKCKVQIVQLLTGEVREAQFDLPDREFGGQWFPVTSNVTDGYGPNVVDLTRKDQLKIHPASRQASGVVYRMEVAGSSQSVRFAPNTNPLNTVAQAGKEQSAGGIHSVDVKLGAYNDNFRIVTDHASGQQTLTISALNNSKPQGASTIKLKSGYSGRLEALQTEGIHLAFDLDGDGKSDVEIYDQMQEPARYDGGGDPSQRRNHRVRVRGAALEREAQLYFSVNYGAHITGGGAGRAGGDRQYGSSATMAVETLGQQKALGGFADQLGAFEGAMFRERKAALDKGYISRAVYDAWTALSLDMVILRPQVNANQVDGHLQASATQNARAFYAALANETRNEFDIQPNYSPHASTVHSTNEHTGQSKMTSLFGTRDFKGFGAALGDKIAAGQWTRAYGDYNRLVTGLDSYISKRLKRKEGKEDKDTQRVEYLGAMKRELGEIQKHKPERVYAGFHPDAKYEETGRIQEVPLQLYVWHDGSDWHLKDLTNPDNTFEDNHSGGTKDEPPPELFAELDYKAHFPKGIIRYETPGGRGGIVRTTERKTLADWLTYIGLGVAAIGLGLATLGTGTVAVAGVWVLAGAGVINATAAAASLYDKADHGHLTAGTAALDIAQIVASLAGAGAIASGRIIFHAAGAAAKGAPLTGNLARLAGFTQKAYVPLTATAVGADVLTVALMSAETIKQLEAIENGSGNPGDKSRAKALLLTSLAVAGGLVVLSIKGDLPNLKGGPDIHVDIVNGVPVARLAGAPGGPTPGPTRVGQAGRTAEGVEGALRQHDGRLPPDAVEALVKGLPEANIDAGDPLGGIARYLADELKVPADALEVKLLGGGYSGAGVYAVKHNDEVIGIFKVFRDQGEMLREVAALKRIADLDLETLKPVGLGTLGSTGTRGVGLMDPAEGDFVADSFKKLAGIDGQGRLELLGKIKRDVAAVGKGLGELGDATTGGKVSAGQKAREIGFLEGRWSAIMRLEKPGGRPAIAVREQAALRAKLDEMLDSFQRADVPTSVAHGDAHGGNFSVTADGKVNTIDIETLFRSVGPDGKAVGSLGTDVGRFNEWIAITGLQSGMTATEIKALQEAFLGSFMRNSSAARGAGNAFEQGQKFYEVNFAAIQLQTEVMDNAGKLIPGVDPSTTIGMKRLRALLGL
jgi:hypothetical protein